MPGPNNFSLRRKSAGQRGSDAQTLLHHQPMLLIVGSLDSGSRKDVLAYARGLAESQVIAKDACFVDAAKDGDRWLFEVHEGGPGRSLIEWITQQLSDDAAQKVDIPLAGHRVASIRRVGDELVTIVHPPEEGRWKIALEDARLISLGKPLAPFFGSAAPIRNACAALLSVSFLLFAASGAGFFLRSNLIDAERVLGRVVTTTPSMRTELANLPSEQLKVAAAQLKSDAGYLSFLRFDKGRWSWGQATGGIENPATKELDQ